MFINIKFLLYFLRLLKSRSVDDITSVPIHLTKRYTVINKMDEGLLSINFSGIKSSVF